MQQKHREQIANKSNEHTFKRKREFPSRRQQQRPKYYRKGSGAIAWVLALFSSAMQSIQQIHVNNFNVIEVLEEKNVNQLEKVRA